MEMRKILAIPQLRSGWRACRAILVLALGLMVCQAEVSEAGLMGTAFTYQGHLYDANHVADGLYDFQFKLFDDPNVILGNQVGSDVNIPDVDVIEGYFAVELDFNDANLFKGYARWLEIGVRAGELEDPNVYTTLSPRQRITPTPYALYAVAATLLNAADGTPANVVYVDEVGNVGISTMSPGAKLDVAGNQNIRGDLNFSELLSTIEFANDGQINLNGDLMVTSGLSGSIRAGASMELEAGSTMDLQSAATMTITTPLLDIAAPVNVQSNLTVDGNVGIGTVSPSAKLHVIGDAEITGGLQVTNTISGGFSASSTPRIAFGNNADASGGYGAMAVGYNAKATGIVAIALGQSVTASGYDAKAIGRNTTASGQCSTAMGHSITAQGNYSFGIGLDGTSSTVTADNTMAIMGGNVGVGTTNPQSKLSVGGDGIPGVGVYGKRDADNYGFLGGLVETFIGTAGTGVYGHGTSIGVYGESIYGVGGKGSLCGVYAEGDISGVDGIGGWWGINARGKYAGVHAFSSDEQGEGETHIGVSASASSSGTNDAYGLKSNVYRNGSGTYYSGYFGASGSGGTYNGLYADLRTGAAIDLAEYILDTFADTEPADVVVADPENDESVIKSSKPFDSSVVGVISTDPHMVMGMELVMNEETGEMYEDVNAAQLTVTGRIPVKVTDENGPIQRGDLLTTSSKPGHAMKWSLLDVNQAKDFEELKSILAENERRHHSILGKALGSYESGDGEIIALLSLQ